MVVMLFDGEWFGLLWRVVACRRRCLAVWSLVLLLGHLRRWRLVASSGQRRGCGGCRVLVLFVLHAAEENAKGNEGETCEAADDAADDGANV